MTRLNLLASILLATTTGCTGLNHWCLEIRGCVSNHMVDYSNRALAERAWIKRKEHYCKFQYQKEFKDGFISGYLDVADGGDGCTPTIAPQEYWGWAYQTPHGQAAISNFFQGFPFGAKAAEEDGVGYWNAIPTSGLDAFVPKMAPAGEDDLPAPVPVIESDPVSVNGQTNQINQPITSPSDEPANGQFFELADSTQVSGGEEAGPAVKTGTQLKATSKGEAQQSDFIAPPIPNADTDTKQTELTFTFE